MSIVLYSCIILFLSDIGVSPQEVGGYAVGAIEIEADGALQVRDSQIIIIIFPISNASVVVGQPSPIMSDSSVRIEGNGSVEIPNRYAIFRFLGPRRPTL